MFLCDEAILVLHTKGVVLDRKQVETDLGMIVHLKAVKRERKKVADLGTIHHPKANNHGA